ncbi:MAG: ATP-binding cassette domain-containing protein [Bacteroidales bacterium]|nr:ATP-binding cassette domain-containing protein [Bacteroidales bacterium]
MGVIVEKLTKIYGTQRAVDNIGFELKKGEITGFIGPNGSGKSTTMKTICGILTPDMGRVLINGRDIAENLTATKKIIGYLPENNPLYYDQYVSEYLHYAGMFYKLKNLKEKVADIIVLTGLEPERKKKIGQLSKGYKQRVGLAQALLHEPEILILDEPTTGLDPNQLTEIRELIKTISANKTVLLSTHILQEVEAICHKVIMIDKGRIVADTTTDNIRKLGGNSQVVLVEFKEEVPEGLIKQIPFITVYYSQKPTVWQLEGNTPDDFREIVFGFARENNLGILELQTLKRSLEDSFRALSSK